MLTPLDDTLWHQLPTTFDHVGTSDPRFFDRYWFAIYSPDGHCAIQLTMGVYRNMNVIDGAVVVVLGGQQYNLRVSRSIGISNSVECGPLRVELIEPLHAFKLHIEDVGGDLVGEISWTSVSPPEEEAPHYKRERGRVVEDYQRFNQIGLATGWLNVGEQRIDIENWWACRDHSWGVRPKIGIAEPKTGQVETLEKRGFTMAFLFFSTDLLVGSLLLMEREGERPYVTGTVRHRVSREASEIKTIDIKPVLQHGTRRFTSAEITIQLEDDHQLTLLTTALGKSIAMRGLGYSGGYDDGQGLGAWRGDLLVERDIWDVSDAATIIYPDGSSDRHWHRIQPVRVESKLRGETSSGQGSMTMILSGKIEKLGLQ